MPEISQAKLERFEEQDKAVNRLLKECDGRTICTNAVSALKQLETAHGPVDLRPTPAELYNAYHNSDNGGTTGFPVNVKGYCRGVILLLDRLIEAPDNPQKTGMRHRAISWRSRYKEDLAVQSDIYVPTGSNDKPEAVEESDTSLPLYDVVTQRDDGSIIAKRKGKAPRRLSKDKMYQVVWSCPMCTRTFAGTCKAKDMSKRYCTICEETLNMGIL